MEKVIKTKDGKIMFKCPGCNGIHSITEDIWEFNGDMENPTIRPSILNPHAVCHSYVTDGEIEFLNDSTHDLAGEIVELYDVCKDNYNMELVESFRGDN